MDRVFEISEKTPNSMLVSADWSKYGSKERVAKDMFSNSRELAPEIGEEIILGCLVHWRMGTNRPERGIPALAYSIATKIGITAANIGWHMHSPEVVYMSGFHISWAVGINMRNLKNKKEDPRISDIISSKEILDEALLEYVKRHLPPSEELLEILRAFIYPERSRIVYKRFTMYNFLRKGSIMPAYEILHNAMAKPRRTQGNCTYLTQENL